MLVKLVESIKLIWLVYLEFICNLQHKLIFLTPIDFIHQEIPLINNFANEFREVPIIYDHFGWYIYNGEKKHI